MPHGPTATTSVSKPTLKEKSSLPDPRYQILVHPDLQSNISFCFTVDMPPPSESVLHTGGWGGGGGGDRQTRPQ
jgi:hypothetical protein